MSLLVPLRLPARRARAPERPELNRASRIHPYKSHIIIYRLDGQDILVQRVRHALEDWANQNSLP